jgi:ribosome-binding protein aMBF1 (putative translation factor)
METKRKAKKIYKSKVLEDFFTNKDSKSFKRTEKNMLLALRIENARKSLGWNRVRLAKEMNVEPSVITKWLSGTHNFTTDTLFDIEEVLNISLVNTSEPQKIETITRHVVRVDVINIPTSQSPFLYNNELTSILNLPGYYYGKS